MAEKLSHINKEGDAHMVDVGDKTATDRQASAQGCINMSAKAFDLLAAGNHKKGDVLSVARIAGIMAAKRTADLIPLCHTLPLSKVDVLFELNAAQQQVICQTTVRCYARTGVEMEALTAVQIALLTIYDMCKAVDKSMVIDGVRLLKKTGGKSGDWSHT
ncbi:cyclic pyranopterin monophosphate synthase MoaC [Gammaproteobacteria bacterium AH-315-M22]|nr:cyclic pyranopterin monophosphate synthase MoaC [Gammaproteobacteria bacterium AH-315-M22]